jgi:hypothetical protein
MVSLTVGYVTGEQGHTRDWLFYLRSVRRGFPVLYLLAAMAVVYGLYRAVLQKDRAFTLLLCWTAVPIVLYNISRSRIGWYMIPIYPALALLTMRLLVTLIGAKLAILLVLITTMAFKPVLPRASDFNPDVKAVASYSRYAVDEESVLINYWPGSHWIRPSALFYAGRPLLLVTNQRGMYELLMTQKDSYVLADWEHWEPLQDLGDVIYRSGDYVLVEAREL